MRDQLPDRWRPRNLGAVDPRISPFSRRRGLSNIPLTVATPLLWVVADDYNMDNTGWGQLVSQPTFVDRMGITWTTSSGADAWRQLPGGMNGRNAWLTGDEVVSSTLQCIMESTAVTSASAVTVFFAIRANNVPNTFSLPMIKGTINAEGGVSYNGANMRFAWNGTTVTATPSEGATVVFAGRADATNVDLYINGGLAAGPTASGAAVGSTSSVVCVGGYGADAVNYYTNCVFSEFIFYGSRLSDANRNIVEKYLGRQNAIAVS